MAAGRGHNGGFNPFRNAHGRYSAAGNADKRTNNMNEAIRQVAGGRHGSSSGGGGGDGRGSGDQSTPAQPKLNITDARMVEIDKLPSPTLGSVSAATRKQLAQHLGDDFPDDESLSFALFELSNMRQSQQIDDASYTPLLTRALDEAGYRVPAKAGPQDVLNMMDRVEAMRDYERREKRQLYGASVALKVGDLDAANTFLDGPDGAGIGWTLTRNALRDELGLSPEHDDL